MTTGNIILAVWVVGAAAMTMLQWTQYDRIIEASDRAVDMGPKWNRIADAIGCTLAVVLWPVTLIASGYNAWRR